MVYKPKKRNRFALTIAEQRRADIGFTVETVHAILKEATAGDKTIIVPAIGDPRIAELTQALLGMQHAVRISRTHVKSSQLRERLAAICRGAEEVVPPLRLEVEEAIRFAEGDNTTPELRSHEIALRPDLHKTLRELDALAAATIAVGENALLLHPMTRMPPADFWKAYAQRLAESFNKAIVRSEGRADRRGNPLYKFVVAIVPALTGEHVTFEQVKTHFARGRPVPWTKGP